MLILKISTHRSSLLLLLFGSVGYAGIFTTFIYKNLISWTMRKFIQSFVCLPLFFFLIIKNTKIYEQIYTKHMTLNYNNYILFYYYLST